MLPLQEARKKTGQSLKDAAKKIGVTASELCRWEHGHPLSTKHRFIPKYALALGISKENLYSIIDSVKHSQKATKTLSERTLVKRLIDVRIYNNTLGWAEPVLQGMPEDIRKLLIEKAERADKKRVPFVKLFMMKTPYTIGEAIEKLKDEKLERPLIEDVLGYVTSLPVQVLSSEIFVIVFPHEAQNGKYLGVIKSCFGMHVFWVGENAHTQNALIPTNVYVAGIKKGSALL